MKKIMVAIMVALSIGAVYAGDDYVPVNVNHSNNVTKIVVQNQPQVVLPVARPAYIGHGYIPEPLPVYGWRELPGYGCRPCVPVRPCRPARPCAPVRPIGGGHPRGGMPGYGAPHGGPHR